MLQVKRHAVSQRAGGRAGRRAGGWVGERQIKLAGLSLIHEHTAHTGRLVPHWCHTHLCDTTLEGDAMPAAAAPTASAAADAM